MKNGLFYFALQRAQHGLDIFSKIAKLGNRVFLVLRNTSFKVIVG